MTSLLSFNAGQLNNAFVRKAFRLSVLPGNLLVSPSFFFFDPCGSNLSLYPAEPQGGPQAELHGP